MLKCKHCSFEAPAMQELRTHVQRQHTEHWNEHRRQMERFDWDHPHELQRECPTCKHRGC